MLSQFKLKHLFTAVGLTGLTSLAFSLKSDRDRSDSIEEYINDESRFLRLRGMNVHYRDTGRGPAVVLLHGTAASLHTWEWWTDHLLSDFRVIRLDLPGFGLTGPDPDNRYHLDDYIDFLRAFVDELGLDSFHLAGNSFGGKIAWNFAYEDPDRLEKLVLIDSMGFMDRWPSLFGLARIPVIGHGFKTMTPRWLVRNFIRSLFGNPDSIPAFVYERYYDLLLTDGNRNALYQRLNTPIERVEDRLKTINVPTLIQWGTDDPLLPVNHASCFKNRLRRASVVTYLETGHMPMEERPEQTALDARAFLRS